MDLFDVSLRSISEGFSSNMSIDPFDNSEFSLSLSLRSDDFKLDGALGALSSGVAMHYLSQFFDDLSLPDAATTAANAMEAEQPSLANSVRPPSQQDEISLASFNVSLRISSDYLDEGYDAESNHLVAKHNACDVPQPSTPSCPLMILTKKEEERRRPLASSQNQPTPMPPSHNFSISSSDWAKDFEGGPVDPGPLYPSLFMSNRSIASFTAQLSASTSPPPLNVPQTSSQHEALPVHPSPISTGTNNPPTTSPTISTAQANQSPSPSTPISKKKRKRKTRVLDETRVAEPTNDDVLFGRGPSINKHPGNVRFRQKALEFYSWYMDSSKQQKEKITNLLVESVKPHRFLEKGKDGLWHEVIDGGGGRYKASQTFRDISKYKMAEDISKFSFQDS